LQAAVLLAKLSVFESELDARQQVADMYRELLDGFSDLALPVVPKGRKSAWAQYSVQTNNRDEVVKMLKEQGVPTAIYYPTPLPFLSVYRALSYKQQDFPVSFELSQTIFSLPMHPYLSKESISGIADVFSSAVF